MVRVDDKTIETHFALGSLFRRRGEVDRAIRIHQNIIARPDLASEQRDQALYSLAKDYLAAGLLDRAEKLFVRLSEGSRYQVQATREHCVRIYEQERDWEKAIDAGNAWRSWAGGLWRCKLHITIASWPRLRRQRVTTRRRASTSRMHKPVGRARCVAR